MSKTNSLLVPLGLVWRRILQHRRTASILFLVALLSASGHAVVPYLTGRIVDAILESSEVYLWVVELPLWVFLTVIYALVQLVVAVTDWYINVESERMGVTMRYQYVTEGYSRLHRLPLSFHKSHRVGEIGNKISSTGAAFENIGQNVVIQLGASFLGIAVAFVLVYVLNTLLASVLLVGVLIYVVIFVYIIRPLAAVRKETFKIINEAYGKALESLTNIQEVKMAVAEEREHLKLEEEFQSKAKSKWMSLFRKWQNISLSQRITVTVTLIAIYLLAVPQVISGTMSIGDLLAFLGYSALVFGPFVRLGQLWEHVQNGLVDIRETEEMLSEQPEVYYPKNALSLNGSITRIEFRDVSFSYEDGVAIVRGVNLEVFSGEKIAFVGESGVGKSTLIKLIPAFHFPSQGQVLIDGIPTHRIPLSQLRSRIAMVSQDVVLFNATIRENIVYGSSVSQEELEEAAQKAHALEFIEKFPGKWDQIVGERGIKLSGGQKQRVAIARAILQDPEILILDEPTSALDAFSESVIEESLNMLLRGRTTFIIAHRFSTVQKADNIVVLKDGFVVEQGRHEELIMIPNGEYRRLYYLQIGLHS